MKKPDNPSQDCADHFMVLLDCPVVLQGVHQSFYVCWRKLLPTDLERQFLEFAGELEWHLAVLIV